MKYSRNIHWIALLCTGLFISCGDNSQGSSPESSGSELLLVKEVDSATVKEITDAEAKLAVEFISYERGYKSFTHRGVINKPCSSDIRKALNEGSGKLNEIFNRINPSKDNFKDKSLSIYKKVVNMKESLSIISSQLNSFCEDDYENIKGCLESVQNTAHNNITSPIVIGSRQSSFETVQPLLKFQDYTGNLVHMARENNVDKVSVYQNNLRNQRGIHAIKQETSLSKVGDLNACIDGLTINTKIGVLTKRVISASYRDIYSFCRSNQYTRSYRGFCN